MTFDEFRSQIPPHIDTADARKIWNAALTEAAEIARAQERKWRGRPQAVQINLNGGFMAAIIASAIEAKMK